MRFLNRVYIFIATQKPFIDSIHRAAKDGGGLLISAKDAQYLSCFLKSLEEAEE